MRFFTVLISLLMTITMAGLSWAQPPADSADSHAEVARAGSGTVQVLYVPAEGWAFPDETGEPRGVTADLMRWFAEWLEQDRGLDVTLDFVPETNWRVFYARVRDAGDGVLGLGNVTITEARAEELAFSPPYLQNIAVLVSHSRVPELEGPQDIAEQFSELTPLAFEGTLHEMRLRELAQTHLPDTQLAFSGSNDDILERVAGGGYFAYVDGYNYFRAREQGAELRRHAVLDDPGEEFGVIMPLGSDWQPVLEAFFQHDGGVLVSERYRHILSRHLGESVTEMLSD